MNYTAIGQQIRKFRKLRNISQEQLAEKIDISTTHMSHIETGSTKLSLPVLVKISEELKISTDEILFGEKDNSIQNNLPDILKNCSLEELEIITEIIKSMKKTFNSFSIQKK
ncbi:MAG: helix-turn-helix transcriptional regulator [Treponema sp.]|nr:helix-turn-helix transcriptional regulator [Treponema sp.]